MARRRPDSTSVRPWFRVGVDILEDIPLHRLKDKADRYRYIELCALAKLSVNHTRSNEEIGDLLAGYSDPMTIDDVARKLEESPVRIEGFLSRLKEAMPRALITRENRYHLSNFAKRQYDYASDMPHSGPAKAPDHVGPKGRNGPGLDGEGDGKGEGEGGKASAASGCPFCRKPTKGPLQHYHDEAKRVLDRCLVIPPGKAGPAIARVEGQVGKDRAHTLFAAYLASEDPFVLKNGYSLLTFASESIQNGLATAVDGGFVHGTRAQTKRRNTANAW